MSGQVIHKGGIFILITLVMYFSSSFVVFADDSQIASFEQQVISYQNAGDHEQALVIANQFVAYAEQKYGFVHKNTVKAWHVLGRAYFSDGRYREAEKAYKRALNIEERIVGPNHRALVPHLEALITVYFSLVRFEEAAEMQKRVRKLTD